MAFGHLSIIISSNVNILLQINNYKSISDNIKKMFTDYENKKLTILMELNKQNNK